MSRKPKFKPEIRRIKLNPEQAVLACNCHTGGVTWGANNQSLGRPYFTHCTQMYRAVATHTYPCEGLMGGHGGNIKVSGTVISS